MSVLQKMPPFQNVVAAGTAILPALPQGMTFEQLILNLGGTFTKAMITGLRLWLGGKKIWEVTGSDLDLINQYNKLTANAAFLAIWFSNPRAKNLSEYLVGALDTSTQYSSWYIELDITGATAPTLVTYARLSSPISKDKPYAGMFRTLIKSAFAPAAAQEFSQPVPLGSKQGALIRAVHWFHANITKLQVMKDSFPLMQEGLNAVVQFDQNQLNRTTQSGLISYDALIDDFEMLAVPTLRPDGNPAGFELKVTVSAADNLRTYSDLLQTHAAV